jgi:FkbM family methyltransferase
MFMKIAHSIYRNTPFVWLRKLFFDTYARFVRNRQVVANVDGVFFDLELGELIDLALYLGKFEPTVVNAIKCFCQPGMVVFDIGANIGAHGLRLGNIVGEKGHVYAFEPTTLAFKKLARNLALNPRLNVSTFRLALADETHTRRSICFRSSWRTDGSSKDSTCEVDFVRMDDWAKTNDLNHVDLIKMDVDGNEFGVLAGGNELLKRCQPIFLMEMVGPHFVNSARNPFLFLESIGYEFSNIDTGEKYSGAEEMSHLMASDDDAMTTSMNILAVAKRV